MPILDRNSYIAPSILRNGHVQTIYPFIFRKIKGVEFQRTRLETYDQDFIDLDLLISDKEQDKIAIMSHGLEGSTDNQYIKGLSRHLSSNGFDIAAWNMRSCSGEMNLKPSFYHAAMTNDLDTVIRYVKTLRPYKKILLVGFSLGSNLTAVYLGERSSNLHSEIVGSCLISCPTSLQHSIEQMQKISHKIYMESFLITMRKKVMKKEKLYQDFNLDIKKIKKAKSFVEFDSYVTAPLFGFNDPYHYYNQASCLKYLPEIKVPTLIVNSKDDPFLPRQCFPLKEAKNNPHLYLEITQSGGHLGFMKSLNTNETTYSEERILDFYKEVNGH